MPADGVMPDPAVELALDVLSTMSQRPGGVDGLTLKVGTHEVIPTIKGRPQQKLELLPEQVATVMSELKKMGEMGKTNPTAGTTQRGKIFPHGCLLGFDLESKIEAGAEVLSVSFGD